MTIVLSVTRAVRWLRDNRGLVVPYDTSPRENNQDEINEDMWLATQWNPPLRYLLRFPNSPPDPRASPKPSWDDLFEADRQYELEAAQEGYIQPLLEQVVDPVRQQLTSQAHVTATIPRDGGVDVNIHGGVDRMTGLISMVEDANEANETLPHIILRDDSDQPIHVHTHTQLRPVLAAMRWRKNIVESAHNMVMEQLASFTGVRDDLTKTLDEREEAAAAAVALLENYQTHLQAEIDKFDPESLPDDLDKLRMTLTERLESAALGRSKTLRSMYTQSGTILHPSCRDQAEALEQVTSAQHAGVIEITRANNAKKAKAAFDAAVKAIRAVEVLNTPIWLEGGNPIKEDSRIEKETLYIIADHPRNGSTIPGNVAVTQFRAPGMTIKMQAAGTAHAVELAFDSGAKSGDEVKVVGRAMNECGVSRIVFTARKP